MITNSLLLPAAVRENDEVVKNYITKLIAHCRKDPDECWVATPDAWGQKAVILVKGEYACSAHLLKSVVDGVEGKGVVGSIWCTNCYGVVINSHAVFAYTPSQEIDGVSWTEYFEGLNYIEDAPQSFLVKLLLQTDLYYVLPRFLTDAQKADPSFGVKFADFTEEKENKDE